MQCPGVAQGNSFIAQLWHRVIKIHGYIMDELICDSGNNHPSVNSTNTSFIFLSSQSGQVCPIP
jgi:hypothetical protein